MKKTVLALVSLSLVFVMLLAFASCGKSGPYDGTYVNKRGTEALKLKGSTWTAYEGEEAVISGRFEVNEEAGTIVLYLKNPESGAEVKFDSGSIKEGVIRISEGTFYLQEAQNTANGGNGGIDANSLANAMSAAMGEYFN